MEQLAEGGVLVIPIGGPAGQVLERIERRGERLGQHVADRLPLRAAGGGGGGW